MLLKVVRKDSEEKIEVVEVFISTKNIFAVKADGKFYNLELDDKVLYLIQ